ncbi:ATP-grasp domain-containing protein, partial [Kineococcus sp. SYSU DK003]|uniref:ATP-grasp domain-containing protein n=1 Tax=Kineococcus sp. SYSU DK003 TaxID=3383124 RepID=UPI003D7E6807
MPTGWRGGRGARRCAQSAQRRRPRFARHAVRVLGSECPSVCALDVAWDRGKDRWLVVEVNPLWASGP